MVPDSSMVTSAAVVGVGVTVAVDVEVTGMGRFAYGQNKSLVK